MVRWAEAWASGSCAQVQLALEEARRTAGSRTAAVVQAVRSLDLEKLRLVADCASSAADIVVGHNTEHHMVAGTGHHCKMAPHFESSAAGKQNFAAVAVGTMQQA